MSQINKINLEEMTTLPEAAKLMGFTESYVRRLVRAGRIAGFKFGRNYLVHKQSALEFEKSPGCGRPKVEHRPKR
jgi:excisionase family DNA binding protein